MSQHIYQTRAGDTAVVVQIGWDRPLQGFYAVVEAPEGHPEDYLYSNLDDPVLAFSDGMSDSLDYLVEALARVGITVPAEVVKEVSADKMNNAGNRVVKYDFGKSDKQ